MPESDSRVPDDTVEARLQRARRLATLTDSAVELPLLRVRVGLDALLGLVPVVGDLLGAPIALYFPYTAWRLGAPRALTGRMLGRILVDAAAGTVPVLGDLTDVVLRVNQRNLASLEDWYAPAAEPSRDEPPPATRRHRWLLVPLLAAALMLLVVLLTRP